MGLAHSKCLPLDPWIQDTLPPLLHPTLSHQPCLPASLTPSSPVDQGSRQAGDSLLLFWAGLLSTPPFSPSPQNRSRASSMGYLRIPAWWQAGGQLQSRERQLLGHEGEDTRIAWSSADPSPPAHIAYLCTHTWEHQQVLPCSSSRFLREPEWPSGRRNGHTRFLEALALYLSPLNATKAWSLLALSAWPSTHPSHLHAPAYAHHGVKPYNSSTECFGAPLSCEHT